MSRILLPAVVLLVLASAGRADIETCHALADIGDDGARNCYLTLLQSEHSDAVRAEALWRIGDIEAANRAFRRAVELHPDDADLLVRWGMLFVAAHQVADANALFKEALAADPKNVEALLGQAELMVDGFAGPASFVIGQILMLDPDNARALILEARLLLEAADLTGARGLLTELMERDNLPISQLLKIMALLAAADHMEGTAVPGKRSSPWVGRALALNPHYGDIYAVPAYYYVITRRYTEAVTLLEQAVAIDPDHWSAHTTLGTNLLRINRIDDGRRHLERAYAGDSFDAQTVNTLRLLDSLSEFDEQVSERLILRTHPDETAVLTPYVEELVVKSITEMAARYGYTMTRPVVLELYQHHDDFAVRTAGLPGLGILGATFGDVVVMDGPSAKRADQFDWYSAVWHELAHVVTLNATDNLVSRWFSEGVSVHEESRYGPSPNASVPLDFLDALTSDRLLPVADLDNGFMRPEYENQIGISYVQAGLLCTFIADNFDDGLTRILERYHAGDDTVTAIEQGLRIDPESLDTRFLAHLETIYGGAADSLAELKALSASAKDAIQQERWVEAMSAADRAIGLFPEYVGPQSPYLLKAHGAEGAGDTTAAVDSLAAFYERGGRDPAALAHAARLHQEAGRTETALQVQRTLVRLDPLTAAHHATLGDWASKAGAYDEALTEYRAVLALAPHDRATAHYQVASTLHELGRTEEARRELLYALEIAPRFSPALSLLVEINQ